MKGLNKEEREREDLKRNECQTERGRKKFTVWWKWDAVSLQANKKSAVPSVIVFFSLFLEQIMKII